MPDHQGRQDFPEVADEKINIGNFKEWSPLGQADIYSPKEEPKLRDQVMLDQEQMLKELCTLIESFNGKKADKKVEDPYKGSSIKKAAGWTMDKQNPSGEKSEKSGFEMCAKCGDKGNGIEKGGVCKACTMKSVVKSIDNYLR